MKIAIKRDEIALLMSEKQILSQNSSDRQKSTLYIDKRFNSPRKYGNYEHIYTKEQGIKMAPKILSDLKGDI